MTVALFPKIRRLSRWLLFVIALGFAAHTWITAWVPEDMIPCYQVYQHDPYKEAIDWQMAHPFWTGIYSGMTLGFWPNGYAIPKGCSYVNEGKGIPPWAYTAFAHAAFPAFRVYASLFTFFFVWLYAGFLVWAFRPAPGYRLTLPHQARPSQQALSSSAMPRSQDSGKVGKEASDIEDSPA